jgi:hypothetical protein
VTTAELILEAHRYAEEFKKVEPYTKASEHDLALAWLWGFMYAQRNQLRQIHPL